MFSEKLSDQSAEKTASSKETAGNSVFIYLLLIALSICAAYANSLTGAFVLDDTATITVNESLRTLLPSNSALPGKATGATTDGRPLVHFSLAANYALGGLDPVGYHLFNILVHLLAAATLFGLLRLTLASPRLPEGIRRDSAMLAFAAVLLWSLHPIQTNAVTYIVQRAESMVSLFYLLTIYCLARSEASASAGRWLALSVLACFFGAASKEVIATAPLAALLYDRTFLAGSFRTALAKRRLYYAGLGASWLFLAYLMISTNARANTVGFGFGHGSWDYLQTQAWAIARYLRLVVWPYPLILDYGPLHVTEFANVIFPALLVCSLLGGSIYALVKHPTLGFPAFFFFLVLSPTSSFVPILTTVCEYRMYLALASPVTLLVVGFHLLWRRGGGAKRFRAAPLALLAVLAVSLAGATISRNTVFKSNLTVFEDIVAKWPINTRALLWLGFNYKDSGREAEAAESFGRVARLEPRNFDAHLNQGVTLLTTGRTVEAMIALKKALALGPNDPVAHLTMSSALIEAGRPEEALGELAIAEALKPSDPNILSNKGAALFTLGRTEEAVEAFRMALRADPTSARARQNLEKALAATRERGR